MMPLARQSPALKTAGDPEAPKLHVFPQSAVQPFSPSLQSAAELELPAYEMKYILSEQQAREIQSRLRDTLVVDAHDDSARGDGYEITTLYTDTDLFDVYYHEKPFRRHKYRLRRYGMAPLIYLERRSRWRDRIKKRRNTILAEELPWFSRGAAAPEWAGGWFHRCLLEGNLRPVCRVTYRRVAYLSRDAAGAMRVTFDRSLRGRPTDDWVVEPCENGLPILAGQVICEVKFCGAMPPLFKSIVQDFRLHATRISKYRAFMRISQQLDDKRSFHA
jgi:hypothetical protein